LERLGWEGENPQRVVVPNGDDIFTKMTNSKVKCICVSIRTPRATFYLQTNTPPDRKRLALAASNKSDTVNLPLVHTY